MTNTNWKYIETHRILQQPILYLHQRAVGVSTVANTKVKFDNT